MTPFILCLGTRWSWVVSLTPWSLYPREKYCGTYRVGGSVNPTADLHVLVKNENYFDLAYKKGKSHHNLQSN